MPAAIAISETTSSRSWTYPPVQYSILAIDLGSQHPDEREVAIAALVVEPVADHEFVGAGEPDVARVHVLELLALAYGLLVEQRTQLDRGRPAAAQVLAQVVQREAGVDDVFDDDHVPAFDRAIEILHDANHTRGLGAGAVGGHGHEVDRQREVDRAREVGEEGVRALEDAEQQRILVGVVDL